MSEEDLRKLMVKRVLDLPGAKLALLQRLLTAMERGDAMLDEILRGVESKIQSGVVTPQSKSQIQSGVVTPHSKIVQSQERDWPHAPIHRLRPGFGTYLVTAGTLYKQHFFRTDERLDLLHDKLLELAKQFDLQLEAWAVFSNHYHFVGQAKNADNLQEFLGRLHMMTAKAVNKLDLTEGRKVWHNFWETELTYERSYFARLNYVHQNAVKHGLTPVAHRYRWCSAAWFERTATPAQVKTIYGFKIDKLKVLDDFDVPFPE